MCKTFLEAFPYEKPVTTPIPDCNGQDYANPAGCSRKKAPISVSYASIDDSGILQKIQELPGHKLMSASLSIQIVCWNSAHELAVTLLALTRSTFQDFEVLIHDNGSTDTSAEIAARFVREREATGKRSILTRSETNLGFCTPNNRLMNLARAPWVLFLNADCRPEPGALDILMLENGRYPEVATFAPKILEADGTGFESNGRINAFGLGMFADGLNRGAGAGQRDSGYLDAFPDVFCPSGAAGLYRRDTLIEVGGLTESYFAYGDDFDLGLKLRRAGHACRRVPGARFFHRVSHSLGADNPLKYYFVERNRIYNLLRHYPSHLIARSPLTMLRRLPAIPKALLTGDGQLARTSRKEGPAGMVRTLVSADFDAFRRVRQLLAERAALEEKWTLDQGRFESWLHAYGLETADAFR